MRADRIGDGAEDLSEMPHVILSQCRIHDPYLEIMCNSPCRRLPDHDVELKSLRRRTGTRHPVEAGLRHADGAMKTQRAKVVIGCDGARSTMRKSLGRHL
jgi:phenol 2-monooxygenase